MAKLVCVRHLLGWCATKRKKLPANTPDMQATACRHYVYFPWGYKVRNPDCPECLKILKRRKS